MEFLINVVAAYVTSVISAIIGMGGGIALLAVMLMSLELAVAIPLHGAIQFASNISRSTLFRQHISWSIVTRFGISALPFAFLGAYVFKVSNPDYVKWFIGLFILWSIYVPKHWLKLPSLGEKSFFVAGMLTASISMIAGATGPVLAPFFLDKNLPKETIIATKASCQAIIHCLKILLFGAWLQFSFAEHLPLLSAMIIAVLIGTYSGKRILSQYISESVFIRLYKTVLTLAALKILWSVLPL